MHDEQHQINEKTSLDRNMHLDRKTSIGIILGIGIIFGVLSMVSIPDAESEFEDPFSYQTMKSKIMESDTLPDYSYP